MFAVIFVLAATLTLLPAVLAKLGTRATAPGLTLGARGRAPLAAFARWAELLWRHPYVFGGGALAILVALALPVFGLKTGMPSIKVVPNGDSSRTGYDRVQAAFGPGAPGRLADVTPKSDSAAVSAIARRDPGIALVQAPVDGFHGEALVTAIPSKRSVEHHCRCDDRPPALGASRGIARRRNGRGEPRSRARTRGEDTACDWSDPRTRLRAAPRRAPGAGDRSARCAHEPACNRRCVRRRTARLPGRPRRSVSSASSRRAFSMHGGRSSSSR